MGQDITATTFTRAQRKAFREKVAHSLDVFRAMAEAGRFTTEGKHIGLEVELNLADASWRPAMANDVVLADLGDEDFQSELGRFNIEYNAPPFDIAGTALRDLEDLLAAKLHAARRAAAASDHHVVMTGLLPTVTVADFEGAWMTPSARYQALNDAILDARQEDAHLEVEGVGGDRLDAVVASIGPETACTSTQFHLLVAPQDFARYWNAAQALAGPQLALGANSPYAFGHELEAESRIEVFGQAIDTRPPEYAAQDVRTRAFFGEDWITSIVDLFEENSRWFPALLPEIGEEDPQAVLEAGGTPQLAEFRLHNGTVYRWNRPVYAVVGGQAHVRLENRLLPAGPTVIDTLANAAFFYGLIQVVAHREQPVWQRMAFTTAEENFRRAARHGIDAHQFWPGRNEAPASELILRHLLPKVADGLAQLDVETATAERLLSVIEGRCLTGVNGASWQVRCVRAFEERGLTRDRALTAMTRAYAERSEAGEPVHTWDLP